MRSFDEILEHSYKGTTWKEHKYLYITKDKNGKSIYVYTNQNSGKKAHKPDFKWTENFKEADNSNSTSGMKKSLKSKIIDAWNEIRPSTIGQKISASLQRRKDKKNQLPSSRQQKRALKSARKEIASTIKRKSTPNYLLNKSFGARLGATLNRLARTVRNLPDVLNQRVRANKQRTEAKSKLPTEKERTAKLEAARKDLSRRTKANEQKKKVAQKNKEKEQKRKNIARKIYRETGIKVNPNDDIDLVLNGNFIKRTFKKGKSFNGAS